MKPLTRNEMIERIAFSSNKNCANICKRIMNYETTIEKELKTCGQFMYHVLKGNFEEALACADSENYFALTNIPTESNIQMVSVEELLNKASIAQKEATEVISDIYVRCTESPLYCLAMLHGIRQFKEITDSTEEQLKRLEKLIKDHEKGE